MSIDHEEDAKKIYPEAHTFLPVKRSLTKGGLWGWTFEISKETDTARCFAWIACDGTVTSDVQRFRSDAAKIMKAYLRYRRRENWMKRNSMIIPEISKENDE